MDTFLQTAETINDTIHPLGCGIKLVATSPTLLIPQTRQWWVRYFSYQISNLGPTATKFLQWASTRRDIFPESFCAHVSKYQTRVPPQALPHFTSTLTKHLPHSVFVQPKACGTGSVAQVYSILLPRAGTYERCVAKVLRPNVRHRIQRDLAFMNWIASAVKFLTGDREEWLPIRSGISQFSRLIMAQTNLAAEGDALLKFKENFTKKSSLGLFKIYGGRVTVPRVFSELSRRDLLIESFEHGDSLDNWLKSNMREADESRRRDLAKIGAQMFFQMLILDNFVHMDLHPGNMLIRQFPRPYLLTLPLRFNKLLSSTKLATINMVPRLWRRRDLYEIVLLDGGLTSALEPSDRKNFLDLFEAISLGEGYRAGKLLLHRAQRQKCEDEEGFCSSVARLVGFYVGSPVRLRNMTRGSTFDRFTIRNLKLGEVIRDILTCSLRYRVELDPKFVGVLVATLVIEGVGKSLDPNINLLTAARPFFDILVREQVFKRTAA